MLEQLSDRWSAVLADRHGSDDFAATEPGPSLRLLALGTMIPVDWLIRLVAIPGHELVAVQMRSIGARSDQIASHWAKTVAQEIGEALWTKVIPTTNGPCAYMASVCELPGTEALARAASSSTASRDALIMLVPNSSGLDADGELAGIFLRDSTGSDRLEEMKTYARENGGIVAVELRDPDQNIGLALTDGTDEAPWAVVSRFQPDLGREVDGLEPQRFWPALSQ